MRCDECVLEAPGAPLDTFLDKLSQCTECPLLQAEGASPLVRHLVDRHRDAARALRRLGSRARQCEVELRDLQADVDKYESRIAVLEGVQKASSLETEEELRAKIDLVRRQEAALHAMATPIIHVWEGVLVLPVIGVLDAERASILMASLLDAVRDNDTSHAILDLTGVDEVTTETADHLLRVALAVRLLGADVILTGLRSRVAQAIVDLGVDLGGVQTMRSLEVALRFVQRVSEAPRADARGGVTAR